LSSDISAGIVLLRRDFWHYQVEMLVFMYYGVIWLVFSYLLCDLAFSFPSSKKNFIKHRMINSPTLQTPTIYKMSNDADMDSLTDVELFHRCLYAERNLITTYPLKTIVPVDDSVFAANAIQPDQEPCIIDFHAKIPFSKESLTGSNMNKLLVRSDYIKMYEMIRESPKRRTLVIGKPGIGKSKFLMYALYKLSCDKEVDAVIYSTQKSDYNIFTKAGVIEGNDCVSKVYFTNTSKTAYLTIALVFDR
jgi:hypothetical protein